MNPLRNIFLGMSRIPLPVMLLAIVVLAIGVTTLIVSYVHEQETRTAEAIRKAQQAEQGELIRVVKAVKDIPEGSAITFEALEEKEIRGHYAQGTLNNASLAVGRTAKYLIPAGNLVSFGDLAPVDQLIGIEARLKAGYRAVTFPVDSSSGVAGFVAPGSRVDILASAGSGHETSTGCILSDVEVIAVGDTTERAASGTTYQGNTITVAVSTADTTKLIKAQIASGKLYMALRNQKDHAPIRVVDVTSLYKQPVAEINVPVVPLIPPPQENLVRNADVQTPSKDYSVEIISGTRKEIMSVPAI
ncbi:MAG: Flp pilus assembly protein CpaB [Candidatus Obscuribacterales bacterium]|nr:Flp pilus assembly protein CpaB [Candidatus Obscuribacterales bacterium]